MGRMDPPLSIDTEGSVATYKQGSVNIALHFGSDQAGEIRGFDGVKCNAVNLYCAAWAPFKLPTCGHIAKIFLNARPESRKWGFFKGYREATYKQLPMRPEHANLAMVAIRDFPLGGLPSEGSPVRRHIRSATIRLLFAPPGCPLQ